MSYLLIKIHSFGCDYPGCADFIENDEWYLTEARFAVVKQGWQIGPYYIRCPKHHGMTIPSHNGS